MPDERFEVLLVEDNPADADLVREALEGGAFRLEVIGNGARALAILREGVMRPGLILLDLNLPGLSGCAVLSALKQDAVLRTIPVVILSSSRAPQDIQSCYENHANCYVVKPSGWERFLDVVRAVAEFWRTVPERPPR